MNSGPIGRAPFSPGDADTVRQTLYGETVTDVDDYVTDLGKAGFVDIDTTDMTPGDARNNTATLTNFINANTPAILANSYTVPLTFPTITTNFLGANPRIPNPFTMFWNSPGITDLNARHKFSLNTCNACHTTETGTTFTHVKPGAFNTPVALSGFMTGINVVDPVDGAPTRTFNEFERRALDLDQLVNLPSVFQMNNHRQAMTH